MDKKQEKVLEYHLRHQGKIKVSTFKKIRSKSDLSLAYTPGVADICKEIASDPTTAKKYTMKGRMVAIVTDGSAVLGLGNIGPLPALPVMEGKAALLYEFAGIETFPICLNAKTPDEIISAVKMIAPEFAAIMLEDIAAPACVMIERKLQELLDVPVFHDDQHGTAIVVGAAMINASKLTKRPLTDLKVVVSGTGAAGSNVCRMLKMLGVKTIYAYDKLGVVRKDKLMQYDFVVSELLEEGIVTDPGKNIDDLAGLVRNKDVFIGVSAPGILTPEMVSGMNRDPMIFALANPEPEIRPEVAKAAGALIVASGRSDYPNQINNVLVFPGLMKGLLASQAKSVTLEMKKAAAIALASVMDEKTLDFEHVIPDPFDKRAVEAVAKAIASCVKS